MLPNRIATYFAAAAALCAAAVPAVANLDMTSTVGVIGGIGALATVVYKWLDGWAKYEERTDLERMGVPGVSSEEAVAPPERIPPA